MRYSKDTFLIGKKVEHFDRLNSTNTYIKENASELENGIVVITDHQFSGKGRLGRVWNVPENSALTFSFLLKEVSCDVSLFPLLCAVAVNRGISEFLQSLGLEADIKIKWPNDIVVNKRKICGVLCESTIMQSKINTICGIGVNINQPQNYFTESDLPYATSFAIEFGKEFDKNALFHILIEKLDEVFTGYLEYGFQQFKQEYMENLANNQKQVEIIYHSKTIVAKCLGIADNGNLICDYEGETICINSGEASVRGLYGYV